MMQTLNKNKNIDVSLERQPITAYMGRQIFLNRVVSHGADKGLWLHWCHPADQGRKGALKYGHFIAPDQTLEDALHIVHQLIEASIELEMSVDARFNFQPQAEGNKFQPQAEGNKFQPQAEGNKFQPQAEGNSWFVNREAQLSAALA